MSDAIELTPALIAQLCRDHLSADDMRFVGRILLAMPERVLAALDMRGEMGDAEVAQRVLSACRVARFGGSA